MRVKLTPAFVLRAPPPQRGDRIVYWDEARGTYDRHEYLNEKRHAFEALASLIEQIVDPQPNVTRLRDKRS
jgi:hypothetical protein